MDRLPAYVTKRGDIGFTDFNGERIAKHEYQIRLIGKLDSFQAFLGKLEFRTRRSFIDKLLFSSDGINEMIGHVILDIYLFMSAFHVPDTVETDDLVEMLDAFLMENNNKNIRYFQLPIYQDERSPLLNEARTLTRELESFVAECSIALYDSPPYEKKINALMRYLNRLSDVFYCMINMIEDEPLFVHLGK
jgi:cob(I)alamin adenosyltransferase